MLRVTSPRNFINARIVIRNLGWDLRSAHAGLDVVFDWERRDAFCRQPVGDALFNWTERYQCLMTIIESVAGTGSTSESSLVQKLQDEGVIKEIMPLHRNSASLPVFSLVFIFPAQKQVPSRLF